MTIDKMLDSIEPSDIAIKEKNNLTLTKQLRYYSDQWRVTRDKVAELERAVKSFMKIFKCDCGMEYVYFLGEDFLSTKCDKCSRPIELSCLEDSFDVHFRHK